MKKNDAYILPRITKIKIKDTDDTVYVMTIGNKKMVSPAGPLKAISDADTKFECSKNEKYASIRDYPNIT